MMVKTFEQFNNTTIKVTNGDESVVVNIISDEGDRIYKISFEEFKRLIKQNKFNDDKWGQVYGTDDGVDDEDPYWLFVEDINDEEDTDISNAEDYKELFLRVEGSNRGTEIE